MTKQIDETKDKLKKLLKVIYEEYESEIDIDNAVDNNYEYLIGKWDMIQDIKEKIQGVSNE